MKFLLILFLITISPEICISQDAKTPWDNTIIKNWPEGFIPVEIKSSADGKIQKAIFFRSHLSEKQPLIVSLHTWSGDYLQEDPLAGEVALRGWNYIHPDFQGPNNNPNACGSDKVISDIGDAVAMKGNQMNWKELDSRSPIKLPFPVEKRKNAFLNIYAGVHDLQFRKVAKASQVDFLDIYTPLSPGISEKTSDGVHLTEAAQFQFTTEIENFMITK